MECTLDEAYFPVLDAARIAARIAGRFVSGKYRGEPEGNIYILLVLNRSLTLLPQGGL
jgi:hypothetical protein